MTVTPLRARPSTRPYPRVVHRPRTAAADAPWSLTIEITVAGDVDDETLAVLRDLRRLAARPAEQVAAARYLDADLIRIHPDARAAIQGARTLALSRLEFDLLLFFAENPGRVFTREHLLSRVWGSDRAIDRTVDVHIRRLRAKAGEVPLVTTVRGVGYRLADDARLLVVHG
jgi:DNA-binding response OmpR family regulator